MTLASQATLAGILHAALGAWMLLRPSGAREALERFPRSRWPAWVLCAVDLAWVLWIVHGASWGRFTVLKVPAYVAGPLTWLACIRWLDELLAPRMLGGLLLLAANPLLAAARWHPSASSRLVSALVYAWVIAGLFLVTSPFWFRRAVRWASARPARWCAAGVVLAGVGLAVCVLAGTAWR